MSKHGGKHGALNQNGRPMVYALQRVFRYNDNSRRSSEEHNMKTLSLKGAPLPRRREETLPPGSGLMMTAALSVMIWGIVAAVAFLR